MTNVVVIIKDVAIQEILCRNKNVQIEVLDLDTQDMDDLEQRAWRLNQIHKCKSYKNII